MHTLITLLLLGCLATWIPPLVRFSRRRITENEKAGTAAKIWLEEYLSGWISIPVEQYQARGLGANDVLMDLGTFGTLRLRCFWPRPQRVERLLRAWFHDSIGWVIEAETSDGEPVQLYAWSVTHHPAVTA